VGEKRYFWAKFTATFLKISPPSLPDVYAGYCQSTLMDESGLIKTQMGTQNRPEMVAVLGTPREIPPRNSSSKGGSDSLASPE
jgi:hypothetical protein